MAQQTINVGTVANDATGDTLRAAFVKANSNFTELYSNVPTLTAPGPIGSVTPNTGAFTTLSATGNATLGDAEATDTHAIKGATTLLANSASAALTVTQTGAGNAFVVEDSASPDSTPFVIDAGGAVYVGTTGNGIFTVDKLNVIGDGGPGNVSFARLQSSTSPPTLSFVKARGVLAAPVTVNSGDDLGTFYFKGFDGTTPVIGAQILAQVDGTPGTNDMPGRLVFSTTADGASSPTERMRIDSAGNVGIGGTAVAGNQLGVYKNLTGSTGVTGVWVSAAVMSDATTNAFGFRTNISTQNSTFTLPTLIHYYANQSTKGAASTITNQYGFFADFTLTDATNNYGFYSNISNAANRYNFYAAGTAPNYFAGAVSIAGTTTLATSLTGLLKASSGVVGTVVSGTDIKTVNGGSLLGSGDLTVVGFASTDDTATNASYYPVFATTAGGSTAKTSSTKLSFNPSTGTLSAVVFMSTSDANAKDNIRPIGYGLPEVLQLVGKKYEMKDGGKTGIGLIAQDVQKIIPEVVDEKEDGTLGINYPVLTAVLIEAVKTLSDRIAALEK